MVIKSVSQGGVEQVWAVYDKNGNELFKGAYNNAQNYYNENKEKIIEDIYGVDGIIVNKERKDKSLSLKNFGLKSSASEIDGSVKFHQDNFANSSAIEYDGVSAFTSLDKTYILENDGDYIEYVAKHNNIEGGYLVNTGLFGLNDGTTNNAIGFNNNDNMYLRGSTSDWMIFSGTGVNHDVFNKYKFIVNGANLDLYLNGVYNKSAILHSPISINAIASCYGSSSFVNASVKSVEIHTSINSLSLVDNIHNEDTFVNTDTTETIIEQEFDFSPFSSKLQIIYDGANNFDIYKPIANRKYVRYEFERSQYKDNSDNWRIPMISICNEDLTTIEQVLNGGACETAIKINDGTNDADDFIGGQAHGDEVLTSFSCFIDGVKVNMFSSFNVEADAFEFIQHSDLFAPIGVSYAGDLVAQDVIHWGIFTHKKSSISHNLTFKRSTTLIDTYLFMLPILRKNGETQITDTYLTTPEYIEYDVSEENHTNNQFYIGSDIKSVKMWSEESGISVEAELTEGALPTSKFNVSPSSSYNKLYWDVVGDWVDVVDGDNYKSKGEFEILYTEIKD